MAMEPEELEQIVNAISKGFEKAQASSPSSSRTFKEFDVGFRTTSKRLQDLAEIMSSTAKGTAQHAEAQKLFVRTLKGKLDDISSSSGTLEEKMKVFGDTLDKVDNVTDDYKNKLKKSAEEQIKNTQGSKEYREQLDKVNKGLDNFGKNFAPLGTLIGGIVKSYQSGGSAIGLAGSILSAEVGFAGDSAKMLGSGLQSVGSAAAMSGGRLSGIGIAAMAGGTALTLFGKGLDAVATKVIPLLTSELDKAYTAFRDISSTGAMFAGGLDGMKAAGKSAGLDLQQFSGVLKQNAEVLSKSGLGMSEGARKIGEAFEGDRRAGNKMRQNLLQLGYSYEEQAGLIAETMALMRQSGKILGPEYDKEIRSETQRYAENLRMISSITGDDAKKRMAQAQQAAAALAFQQKLNEMQPAERKKAIEAMSTLTKDEQQAFMEMTVNNGRAMTKSSAILLEQSPNLKKSLIEYYDAFNNRTLDLDKAGEISARNQKGINDDFMKNKLAFAAMAGIGGDIGAVVKQIEDINQLNQNRTPEAIERAKEERRLANIQADKDAEVVTLKTKAAEQQAAINKQANDILRAQGKVPDLLKSPEDAKAIYDPAKDKDLSATTAMLETVKAGQVLKLQIQDTILTPKVIGNFADAMVKATNDISEAIKKFDPNIQAAGGVLGSLSKTLSDWALPLAAVVAGFSVLKTIFSAGKGVYDFAKPKIPPPGAGDFKPGGGTPTPGGGSPTPGGGTGGPGGATTGGFKVDLKNPPGGTPSGPPGPAGGTGNKEPSKPAPKSTLGSRLGALAEGMSAKANTISTVIAGATAAFEGNLGGVLESIKEIAAGTKVAGAEAVKPAASAATTAATEAAKPTAKVAETVAKPATTAASTLAKEGAESATKLAGKEAATLGAKAVGKSILKKLPGIGFLVGLANAGQRAMDGDWVGAGLEVASGTASILPGAGTAASVALDATLAAKDAGVFGKKEEPKTEATTVTPIAEPPTKLPENSTVVPTVPKMAGASVFDRTPGEGPVYDPRTPAEKEKFNQAVAAGKTLQSVFDDPTTARARGVEKAETLDTSTEIGKKIADQIKAVNLYSTDRGQLFDRQYSPGNASEPLINDERQTFSDRISAIQPREAFINRTGMLPEAQNVAPNNPQSTSDLDTRIKEIVATYEKNRADLDKNDPMKQITSLIPSKATTDDVVQALQGLAMQFGRAVGLLDDIANHSGSTASNTRKQLQGQ